MTWGFAGDPIPKDLLADIASLAESVPVELAELLNDDEITALQRRPAVLLAGALPVDRTGIRYPWPLIWSQNRPGMRLPFGPLLPQHDGRSNGQALIGFFLRIKIEKRSIGKAFVMS
jgi:hypothetical protein